MGGVGDILKAVTDPIGEIFERDRKGIKYGGLFDPGGEILGEMGVDEARKIADPADLYSSEMSSFGGGPAGGPPEPEVPEEATSLSSADTAYYESLADKNRRRARSGGRASTMLSTGSGSTNIGTTQLLGR